uniref:Fibroblast growth factor n=1 Tax=Leptobrachium leishanense TaxID=445787 RepID=A0A8C5W5Z8_9ANUR
SIQVCLKTTFSIPSAATKEKKSRGKWAKGASSLTKYPGDNSSVPGSASSVSSSSSSSGSLGSEGIGGSLWSTSGRRTGSLYCRVGIGFHLQIHPDGRVNGSHEANRLSILEIFAVSQGIVGIRGVFSNAFLAMSKKGKLHATDRTLP